MTSASATTRLNRATEDWPGPLDAADRDQINLEKQLWLLTELHLRDTSISPPFFSTSTSLENIAIRATQRPGPIHILDICSRKADLFHLAALQQPAARIAHLHLTKSNSNSNSVDNTSLHLLPPNVASIALSANIENILSLPLGDVSFEHVRITPSAIGSFSSPQLRALLMECHRVLAVRGYLEVRLVDPSPPCATTSNVGVACGPATTKWIESELLLALESRFQCTRPVALIPVWARDVGLEVLTGESGSGREHEFTFRVCVPEGATVEDKLEMELGRELLRAQYPFVTKWVWDVDECQTECLERGTRFRVVSVFAIKS